jgi:hypothetical protein
MRPNQGNGVSMQERRQEEHAARVARNQDLFRNVNERVKDVNEAFGDLLPLTDWLCECADTACAERIALTLDEYEALRAEPTQFAVAPSESHVFFEVENVVDQTERYWVVDKIGTAARVAADGDPRS